MFILCVRDEENLTSWRHRRHSGSLWGWAASGSLHNALRCSPPPGPEKTREKQDQGDETLHQLRRDSGQQNLLTQHKASGWVTPPNEETQTQFYLCSPRCLFGSWTGRSSASCCHLEPGRSTPERTQRRGSDRGGGVGKVLLVLWHGAKTVDHEPLHHRTTMEQIPWSVFIW